MEKKVHEAFGVHMLNDDGKAKAKQLAEDFDALLAKLTAAGVGGRYLSIVTTKLEEACFFAKKGLASKPENTVTP